MKLDEHTGVLQFEVGDKVTRYFAEYLFENKDTERIMTVYSEYLFNYATGVQHITFRTPRNEHFTSSGFFLVTNKGRLIPCEVSKAKQLLE